jgi:hypothetical protein
MPRALSLEQVTIPHAARGEFARKLAERREHFAQANCRFWVFEAVDAPGEIVEFVEGDDADTVRSGLASAPHAAADGSSPPRIYQEVES